MYNNSLPVGARLGNRYRRDANLNIDERCRLCLVGTGAGQRETFSHVFFQCPSTNGILLNFCNRYINDFDQNNIDRTLKRFILGHDNDGEFSLIDSVIFVLFFYEIWNGRQRSGRFSLPTIVLNMEFNFDGIIKSSSKLFDLALLIDNEWCRNWRERSGAPYGDGAQHWRG